MASYYGTNDYSTYGRHTNPTVEYGSSDHSYPGATRTDVWVGDTWRRTGDATYDRTLGSYPHGTNWTAPPTGDNWHKQSTMTTGRTLDRRGSFDEYVMKVATGYIKPSGNGSLQTQSPTEFNSYMKSSGYGYGSGSPSYTNNDMVRSGHVGHGATMSDPTNNIGLAVEYLKESTGLGSTAPSSQFVGEKSRTQQYVDKMETIVDPSKRYGNMAYFKRSGY